MDTRRADARQGRLLPHMVSVKEPPVGILNFLWRLPNETSTSKVRRITAWPVASDVEEESVAAIQLVPDSEPSPAPAPHITERVAEILHAIPLQALHRQGKDIEIEHASFRSVHRRLCRT